MSIEPSIATTSSVLQDCCGMSRAQGSIRVARIGEQILNDTTLAGPRLCTRRLVSIAALSAASTYNFAKRPKLCTHAQARVQARRASIVHLHLLSAILASNEVHTCTRIRTWRPGPLALDARERGCGRFRVRGALIGMSGRQQFLMPIAGGSGATPAVGAAPSLCAPQRPPSFSHSVWPPRPMRSTPRAPADARARPARSNLRTSTVALPAAARDVAAHTSATRAKSLLNREPQAARRQLPAEPEQNSKYHRKS